MGASPLRETAGATPFPVPNSGRTEYFEQKVYGENGWMLPAVEPDECMRRLATLPLMSQPGERWLYNVSDDVLGVLVARVTGQSFEAFLRERIRVRVSATSCRKKRR